MLSSQIVPLLGRFSDIHCLLPNVENKFDAVLFDVGMSSMQADSAVRGFSVSRDAPLDMRLDADRYFTTYSIASYSSTLILHNVHCVQ